MSSQIMDNTCFIIMLILYMCIDQGDGHWKERNRENLQHDIELYRKMAEKIEREIESFYDEYPDKRYTGDNVDRIHYKHITHKLDRKTGIGKQNDQEKNGRKFSYGIPSNVTSGQPPELDTNIRLRETMTYATPRSSIDSSNKSTKINSSWPKFEDILSAMGKKYDWKNDRWIKVKEKLKQANKNIENNEVTIPKVIDSSEFHEKHKFSYRIVKLNKSKSRRNVVVAVSAVR